MTRHEKRCTEVLSAAAGRKLSDALVEKLLAAGLIDLRACERIAIFRAVCSAEKAGIPRCEAFEQTARDFCCSYEKARNVYYRMLRVR